jgi:hypothetical protein
MSNLGMGAMITMLGGNEESVAAFTASKGKTINALELTEDALTFTFTDGSRLVLADSGQSCCESRYMRTDDVLDDFVGGTLMDAEVRDGPDIELNYGTHEQQFLVVTTSKGVFTVASHNEHNGYYGGICIRASLAS